MRAKEKELRRAVSLQQYSIRVHAYVSPPDIISVRKTYFNIICIHADKELTKNDLQKLMSILSPAVRKWKHIGAQIRLDPNILDDIETTPGLIISGPEAFLEESIMWWLRKHSTEPPTVQVLLRA